MNMLIKVDAHKNELLPIVFILPTQRDLLRKVIAFFRFGSFTFPSISFVTNFHSFSAEKSFEFSMNFCVFILEKVMTKISLKFTKKNIGIFFVLPQNTFWCWVINISCQYAKKKTVSGERRPAERRDNNPFV